MVEKLAGAAMGALKKGGNGESGGGGLYSSGRVGNDPFDIIEKKGGLKSMELKSESAQWKLKSANDKAAKFVGKFLHKYCDNTKWVNELAE